MKKRLMNRITALVTAAFALVAALAWNDAVKSIFSTYFGPVNNMIAMILYAVFVTVIAVIVAVQMSKFSEDKK